MKISFAPQKFKGYDAAPIKNLYMGAGVRKIEIYKKIMGEKNYIKTTVTWGNLYIKQLYTSAKIHGPKKLKQNFATIGRIF